MRKAFFIYQNKCWSINKSRLIKVSDWMRMRAILKLLQHYIILSKLCFLNMFRRKFLLHSNCICFRDISRQEWCFSCLLVSYYTSLKNYTSLSFLLTLFAPIFRKCELKHKAQETITQWCHKGHWLSGKTSQTSLRPPSFCPPTNTWRVQWSISFSSK